MRHHITLLALSSFVVAAGCARSPADEIRNVVLISIDALGAQHSSAYGYERLTTPRLDAVAEQGVLFERAYTNQVWTLTAHLSMLTGLYPQAHGASEERPSAHGATSLAEILKANGFHTAVFTGARGYMRPKFGLGRGVDRYVLGDEDAARDNRQRLAWLANQAKLRANDPDHRFFMFAHYFDVHSDEGTPVPYFAPEPYGLHFLNGALDWEHRGDTGLLRELRRQGEVGARDREVVTALYDGGVYYTDQVGLGPLLDGLEANGFDDDTLVIITADHGEEIFEHGLPSHQQPYEVTARVPLVVRGPGIAVGRRIAQPAELVDLMPTVLALLGLPVPAHVQGRDLSPWLRADSNALATVERDVYVDGIFGGIPDEYWRYPSGVTGWVDGERFSYVGRIRYEQGPGETTFEVEGREELYLLEADPGQERDVSQARPGPVAALRSRLLAWYAANDAMVRALRSDAGSRPNEELLSEEERKRLEALGYVR